MELVSERACDRERLRADDCGDHSPSREGVDVAVLRVHPDHGRQPVFARLPRRALDHGRHRGRDRGVGLAGGVDVCVSVVGSRG